MTGIRHLGFFILYQFPLDGRFDFVNFSGGGFSPLLTISSGALKIRALNLKSSQAIPRPPANSPGRYVAVKNATDRIIFALM